jgi:hypothetical protein
MADNKPIFIAHVRRNEVDGHVYEIGEKTELSGLTNAQIGHVVGRGFYGVLNPDDLSDGQKKAIKKEMG